MGKPKGSEKTGGRKRGTPNRTTSTIREWLTNLIGKNQRQMERDLKELLPKERLMMLEKLMGYVVPKQQAVSATIDYDKLSDSQLDSIITELTKNIDENGEEKSDD